MLAIVFILYIIAYIYSIEIAPRLTKSKINELHESCVMCGPAALTSSRGSQYYIGSMDKEKNDKLKNCIITFWGFMHYLLYACIGYVAPDLFWETFAIGVGFEVYEKYAYNCEDMLDIAWNSLGFATGAYISKLKKTNK